MYDGEISGNSGSSGGVYIFRGSFNMLGGKITGNEASMYVGGIHVADTAANVVIKGEVSGNKSTQYGGGICTNAAVQIIDANITGNTAKYGGGVCGFFSKNPIIALGGRTVISQNTATDTDTESNLMVFAADKIAVDNDTPLADGADIGVLYYYHSTNITETSPFNLTSVNGTDYSKYFNSDNADYVIKNTADNIIQLAKKVTHNHPVCGANCTHEDAHTAHEWVPLTYDSENEILSAGDAKIEVDNGKGFTLEAGNYYFAEDITLKCGFDYDGHININKATNLCLNGHKLNGYISAGGYKADFKLCDCSDDKSGEIKYPGTSSHGYEAAVAIGPNVFLQTGDAEFTMYGGALTGEGENIGLSANSGKAITLLGGSVKGGNESHDIIVRASMQYNESNTYVPYTPLAAGYAIPAGTRIGAYWDYDRSRFPDPPVVRGAQGYTLTQSDLENVTATAMNEDHSSINFAKKLKDNQIMLEEEQATPSPSVSPSESPSVSPSESPSASPSESPSMSPSESPSASPSESPSVSPSESPSVSPSESPSISPSESPSASPSESPTPTVKPHHSSSSRRTTLKPSATPAPTASPTAEPISTNKPSDTARQHKAYIVGYDGKFIPDGNITRAETAAILAQLTDGFDENESYKTSFADVDNALWYANHIGFVEGQGIITGYQDGIFKPEESVTRAEFASMITRFAKLNTANADTPFTDTDGHWASDQITSCADAGYIRGYEDNTFKPDNYITRAEAITIINRVTGRNDIKDFKNPFTDMSKSHWAYTDIMEAAITHNVDE